QQQQSLLVPSKLDRLELTPNRSHISWFRHASRVIVTFNSFSTEPEILGFCILLMLRLVFIFFLGVVVD
ncbi:hypothetical protein Zm00014a_022941, partial [Zea mays]